MLTKQELIRLINDEIKLNEQQSINLVDIINQAALSEQQSTVQDDWERRADEIRSELKRVCIEIESKGLAECRQTDITSHRIEGRTINPSDTKFVRFLTIVGRNSNK